MTTTEEQALRHRLLRENPGMLPDTLARAVLMQKNPYRAGIGGL